MVMRNGNPRCHGLAFLPAAVEGVLVEGTLSFILSSLAYAVFNHFVDSGEFDSECGRGRLRIQACVRGDYLERVQRKSGFADALTNAQPQGKPELWNRADTDL